MAEEIKFPSEMIELPSGGKLYGKVGTFSYGTGVESSVGDFSGEVIYDGACGSCGFLVEALTILKKANL